MSEDKSNEDEEQERKNEFFDDGDDFGLPDLDYDELEEGEEDEPLEEEINFDIQSEETPIEETPQEDSSLDFGADETPSYDEESVSTDDLSAEDFEISEEELEGVDFEGIDIDNLSEEDSSEIYGEESFSGFEPDPEAAAFAAESSEAAVAAENYRELAEREDKGAQYRYSGEQSRSSFTKIVIVGTVVILALASAFWWYSTSQNKAKEEARLRAEQARQEAAAAKKREQEQAARDSARLAQAPKETATAPQSRPSRVAATPGEIQTLDSRTGNSYIIIGSFVDSDLANDYAKELADAGESPTIITPPGNQLFYRVAIASFNSYEEASAALGDFKPDYGEDTWALRY